MKRRPWFTVRLGLDHSRPIQKYVRMRFFSVVSLQIEELPLSSGRTWRISWKRIHGVPPRNCAPNPEVANVWLAYIGPKLQRGVSGLGQTPCDALEDFNLRFMELLISRNGSEHE